MIETILMLGTIIALGYIVIIWKAIGEKRFRKWNNMLDIILTLAVPFFFIGGAMTGTASAFAAGLIFSVLTAIIFQYRK